MAERDSYRKTVLENGVTIVTERDPAFYSVSAGIWVKSGARHEDPSNNGISHFIEHMLFKGTKRRSALDIAREMDSIGGVMNAFTTSETTCYYVKVLDRHFSVAADLLADIFLNSLFDDAELERERSVILQEIRMVEDTPDDYIHELFGRTFWRDHPLGRPVIGNSANVSSFTRDDLIRFVRERYSADRVVITAAGKIDHDEIVDGFANSFRKVGKGGKGEKGDEPSFSSNVTVKVKDLEQVHFCLGTKGVSSVSPRRYAAYILNTILGSGMSSRLFQEVREKRGLAYSIYSFLSTYVDAGLFGVYAGAAADTYLDVLELVVKEMGKLKLCSVSSEELKAAKEQIKGNMILGLESSDSRMQRLANNEICFGREVALEESLERIDAVTMDDIVDLARDVFEPESLNLAVLGDANERDVTERMDEIRKILDQ